ncbi:unnamed protein product [Nyctereutes procyonoides]|uniref:(raccoon dog) hypothetical protein n=1 Tax=Nyctereutes procyonoides TaxID=34880 RepID=A0A812A0C4_NYCPR|nr:unnamed protein product [Nyctereutes procyonoides]
MNGNQPDSGPGLQGGCKGEQRPPPPRGMRHDAPGERPAPPPPPPPPHPPHPPRLALRRGLPASERRVLPEAARTAAARPPLPPGLLRAPAPPRPAPPGGSPRRPAPRPRPRRLRLRAPRPAPRAGEPRAPPGEYAGSDAV